MKKIIFFDLEIEPNSKKLLDIGAISLSGDQFHSSSKSDFLEFAKRGDFLCGHNVFKHDFPFLKRDFQLNGISEQRLIDTLYLSPLLFPSKPYHALVKDHKLQHDGANDPLIDSVKTKELFTDICEAYEALDQSFKEILSLLLSNQREFQAFFSYINSPRPSTDVCSAIHDYFAGKICRDSNLLSISASSPIELAYCLSLIRADSKYSITPRWVLKSFPEVEQIMFRLRNTPCLTGCRYCDESLDIHSGLKRFFGYDTYRSYGEEPLQEKAVKAAIQQKSILAIFPTGGGKSITFQVPALMAGALVKGLTVVISPLQSLMKDQVDNLEKLGITDAVTINGLLDPIERSKSFERVEDGSASILYISPESLRSRSIERLLLGRNIVRFVIDEAHCFSSWGQDFRVDYLYIADFIKNIQILKNLSEPIPVSCFTATAKKKVIEDIALYFKEKLNLKLTIFSTKVSRTNLHYKVFLKEDEEEKYIAIRNLIEEKNCPSIIYVSRTRKATKLAERLCKDGIEARCYHGKMDKKEKSRNQDDFTQGSVQVMVATSAFGMGVDKKDVGMVIHLDISDSLENYVQEAGRAGRDEAIQADCFVLFNEEDLSKHFILLNQTKLSIKEIQQVWKAVKDITKFRSTVSNSALEIARKAGWDDNVIDIETRVTSAIAALEDSGYLKRGQNMPKIYANSILVKTAQEAIDRINESELFEPSKKESAIRIIKKLFSNKHRKSSDDEVAEARVDYISDHLGIVKEEVINIVRLLRETDILADAKDLIAFIQRDNLKNKSLEKIENFSKLENFLLSRFSEEPTLFNLKELNESAILEDCDYSTPIQIKTIINFWAIKNWIRRQNRSSSKNHFEANLTLSPNDLKERMRKRNDLSRFIVDYLSSKTSDSEIPKSTEILVEFSVLELKKEFDARLKLFDIDVSLDDVEDSLFYLSRIDAISIEGGFMVSYNQLTLERLEQDNKRRYKAEDYQKLDQFYENKIQQIHIVGEYAKMMISDYQNALQFVEDYFQLNYASFLNKYFKGTRQQEIKKTLTPAKFKKLFGELSPAQLKIIKDSQSKYIVVAAGPGSGKTRVLVHKLASLLLMEDVKYEQLLMLTFSRAAASEFKKRLIELIGNIGNLIEIKTFHSYCFDLLGKVGSLEKSDKILQTTVEKIRNRTIDPSRITKTVLVIDEAQDMNKDEFGLIEAIMEFNEEMRVIAVGDDDQNIFEFRGASSDFLKLFIEKNKATFYELVENYRSKANLVDFSNRFVQTISERLKSTPIFAMQKDLGGIKLINYSLPDLTVPLVEELLESDLSGTICILTKDNQQAENIFSFLQKKNQKCRLIQDHSHLNLYDLVEFRFLLDQLKPESSTYAITEERIDEVVSDLISVFEKSDKLKSCLNLVREFKATHTKRKYHSDLEVLVRESNLDDFWEMDSSTIYISTIHKAKGKEFDHVILLLSNFKLVDDRAKRLFYVALTRAKNKLTIHSNSIPFKSSTIQNLQVYRDEKSYPILEEILIKLDHSDVWLSYSHRHQKALRQVHSGMELEIFENGCGLKSGEVILKFSRKFQSELEERKLKGYFPSKAKVNYIMFWEDDKTQKEILIALPEISLKKATATIPIQIPSLNLT